MGEHWLKRGYHPSDYYDDGVDVRPDAIRPGLYFECEADFDAFLGDPGIERVPVERAFTYHREADRPRAWPPLSVAGVLVRVATSREADWFRANPLPAPPSSDASLVLRDAACRVTGMPPPSRPVILPMPKAAVQATNVIPFRIPGRLTEAKDRGDR